MACDLCGAENSPYLVSVEGTNMTACKGCSSFGRVIDQPNIQSKKALQRVQVRIEYDIVDNFAAEIRSAREKSDMSQKDFAIKIRERESTLKSWEAGSLKPTIEQARKLTKILGINFVTEMEEGVVMNPKSTSETLTLGDVARIKS